MHDFTDELALPFQVEPGRDYRAEIDQHIPPWTPAPYQRSEMLAQGAALAEQPHDTPREVVDVHRQRTYVVSHIRYERALDPNGLVCCVNTSTCRPGPETEAARRGEDGQGTIHRVHAEKQEAGWLFLEPGASFAGRRGNEYLAWCMAVRERRKARYEAEQRSDADAWQSKQLLLMKEQAKLQAEMTGQMADRISGSIVEALQAMAVKDKHRPAAE